jgi:hypothetical protein
MKKLIVRSLFVVLSSNFMLSAQPFRPTEDEEKAERENMRSWQRERPAIERQEWNRQWIEEQRKAEMQRSFK